ncbi:MAG TPA: ABC transporter permease [Spirochaetota bacterium]|nr:ABC transporter permease [Spirochaetota bacterium]HOL57908.1 ABC transporter permease [Spirochaetota bacterium]HPP04770.1 ABC transporter permease [Spirochaetota bacterium]
MNSLFSLITIAYRNIFRNLRRSIFCIIAIAVAVFFIVIMISFVNGMLRSYSYTLRTYEIGDILINSKDFENKKEFYPLQFAIETEEDLETIVKKIESIKGVKSVNLRITAIATLTNSNVKHAVIWGVDFEKEASTNFLNQKTKSNGLLKDSKIPDPNKNECLIGYRLAKKIGLNIGDKLQMKIVSSQYSDKFFMPKVVGMFDFDFLSYDNNYIIVPIDKLQKVANLQGQTQQIFVFLENPEDSSKIIKEIENIFNKEKTLIKEWKKNYWVTMLQQVNIIYSIIYIVFIIVASFLIVNTIIMVIHERIKEIGMMGALGMKRGEIVGLFFLEAVILSKIGSLIGIILGGIVTGILQNFPISVEQMTGGIELPISNTIYISFSFIYLIEAFFFGIVVSSICTIFPSLKSAFIEPVEALRR